MNLPDNYELYTDKYFLRTKEILEKKDLNPVVKIRLFVREDCKIYGVNEAIEILKKYSNIETLGEVWALPEGTRVKPKETFMVIKAPVQEIVALETMYLGVISAETTKGNICDITDWGLGSIYDKAKRLVKIAGRPISYFGARHWRWDKDSVISKMALSAGFTNCSTDIGAMNNGTKGIGTIPHVLEAIFHWKYGLEHAVLQSTLAFDEVMDKSIPRIALVDYANREIQDSIRVCSSIPNLYGIRVDTCGENVMEGCVTGDHGVSLSGVMALKSALRDNGFNNTKIFLTSGFGNEEKLNSFVEQEYCLGYRLFDELGIGELYSCITATADVVEVEGEEIHKVGRMYIPNLKLERVI